MTPKIPKKVRDEYSVLSFLQNNEGFELLALGSRETIQIDDASSDSIHTIATFFEAHLGEYLFGYLGYDLKNAVEPTLISNNQDLLGFPEAFFYVPELVVKLKEGQPEKLFGEEESFQHLLTIWKHEEETPNTPLHLKPLVSQEEYSEQFHTIHQHLRRGDIYEMNYCVPFLAEGELQSPYLCFEQLNALTQAPFSVYHQMGPYALMSGSPERFFKKEGKHLFSQPIKGTRKRQVDPEQDEAVKKALAADPKERSENVMIVDLVRNDLSRIAAKNSVKVDELLKVYSFRTVHQLISTVSCQLKDGVGWEDILNSLFPMGSMTGAPKIRAMEIIEEVEEFKRGLYSGSFGYITPEGDADFNVIIRSILYNDDLKRALAPVGGAITIQANAEDEYDECLVKVKAMQQALSGEQ